MEAKQKSNMRLCVCGKQELTMLSCSKCKTHYCSRDCQVGDWKEHKSKCSSIALAKIGIKRGKIIMETKFLASAFYKGSACPMSISNKETFNEFTSQAMVMIKGGLELGRSLPQQIIDYTEQLNFLEEKMLDQYKIRGRLSKDVLTTEESITWWINISALLKLKAIKNDNMNGYEIHELM